MFFMTSSLQKLIVFTTPFDKSLFFTLCKLWTMYWILVEKPEGNKPPRRPRRRWVGDMDWIDLAQGSDQCRALVNTVMKLRVP
jgi:hypothetical protein